jgi:methyl-accepting chemotaxis protein
MKLRLFQVRVLYEAVRDHDIINLLIVSGLLSICTAPEDSAEYAEYVRSLVRFFRYFKSEVDSNCLPYENRYLNDASYTKDEYVNDVRMYKYIYLKKSTLMTTLDYKGILGSKVLFFAYDRLTLKPSKSIKLDWKEAIADMSSYSFEGGEGDAEIDALRESNGVRRQQLKELVGLFESTSGMTEAMRERVKKSIMDARLELDKSHTKALSKFVEELEKDFKNCEDSVGEEMKKLVKQETELNNRIAAIAASTSKKVKEITDRVAEISHIAPASLEELIAQINYLSELATRGVADKETFSKMYREFVALAERIRLLSSSFDTVAYHGTNIQGVADNLDILVGDLESKIKKGDTVLREAVSSIQKIARKSKGNLIYMEEALRGKVGTSEFGNTALQLEEDLDERY